MPLIAFACFPAAASVIAVVEAPGQAMQVRRHLEVAAGFYGVELKTVRVERPADLSQLEKIVSESNTVGVVIAADALQSVENSRLLGAAQRPNATAVPILVVDLNRPDQGAAVARWTGTALVACSGRRGSVRELISKDREIGHDLTGIAIPLSGSLECGFELPVGSRFRSVADVTSAAGTTPYFVQTEVRGVRVLAVGTMAAPHSADGANDIVETFSSMAPMMMYVRLAAGDRGWHMPGRYANLTIDDPWLAERYGNLDFKGLLSEMDKHNFHTTIAFIPWNFDRSAPQTAALFRGRPDRWSICVHGNNHDHREFGRYASQPIAHQTANIRQALARMDSFFQRTAIPYDPVMVFPHAIAPAETLRALKRYNYWATINSEGVPLGAETSRRTDPLLRTLSLDFSNFLCIRRISADGPVPIAEIAIQSFLGDPVLVYSHQDLFEDGIGAFNNIADDINRVSPGTRWAGLGEIVRHMYLTRAVSDGYDVRSFSPVIDLVNPTKHAVVMHVRKQEDFEPGLRSLEVDGAAISYRTSANEVQFDVTVGPGESKRVAIKYENSFDPGRTDISKGSIRITLLRKMCDLRDMIFAGSAAGRSVTRAYYRLRVDVLEKMAERRAVVVFLLVIAFAVIGWRLLSLRKRRGFIPAPATSRPS